MVRMIVKPEIMPILSFVGDAIYAVVQMLNDDLVDEFPQ